MTTKKYRTYSRDYAVHPSEDFGISLIQLSNIINKEAPMSADLSLQLETVLGVSAKIWDKLSEDYELGTSFRGGQ
jgi:plasmid maintenance system antidote protein VapI